MFFKYMNRRNRTLWANFTSRPTMSGAQVTFVQMQEPLLEPSSFSYWNSFQINLDEFLEQHGTSLTLPRGLKCWFITLRDGTRLHVYAEQIGEHNCICDQCRIIGKYLGTVFLTAIIPGLVFVFTNLITCALP